MVEFPPIVAGMSDPEFEEFAEWAIECAGIDFSTCSADDLSRAAHLWFDQTAALCSDHCPY